MERARAYRNALDDLLEGHPLKNLKDSGGSNHDQKFRPNLLIDLPLNKVWIAMYAFVSILGLVLTILAFFNVVLPSR